MILLILVAGITICWILLIHPGGGPDEPSHLVRAGAVARGHLQGSDLGNSIEGFQLPDSYLLPETCYAFNPLQPVTCAAPTAHIGSSIELPTTADEYPIWSHLAVGVASRLPGLNPIWWARLAGGLIASALLAWSLLALRPERQLARAGVLLAVTPMAWFTFAIVNPSSVAIGGAIALWTGLLTGASTNSPRHIAWMTAFGWAALALPRRDGLIWACIALIIANLATGQSTGRVWRSLTHGPRGIIAVSTATIVVWGLTNDDRVSRMVAFAPLVVVAFEVIRAKWDTPTTTARGRRLIVASLVVAAATGGGVILRLRPGGWNPDLTRRVVGETGYNVIEAIGVLGWLDTSLPELALAAWFVALGIVAATALFDSTAHLWLAAGLLGSVFATSWAFELFNGDPSGTYWQGRYSLPLLVGVPILLARAPIPPHVDRSVGPLVGVAALVIMNVAAWATARRFGVGVEGSLLPWDWETPFAPIDPAFTLLALAIFSIGLVVVLFERPALPSSPDAR